jgi:YgiT-type zinc finger domain-containing protein
MESGRIMVTSQREEMVIIIKNVPASVCENCGEYTLDEAATKQVMNLAEQAVANHAEIEVLQFIA